MDTVTIERVNAKLSCNHTIEVAAGQPVGAQVTCEKCPTKKNGEHPDRRIKRLGDPVAALVEEAIEAPKAKVDDEVPEGVEPGTPPDMVITAVGNIDGDTGEVNVISLHGGDVDAAAAAAVPDSDDYDVDAARNEWKAVKAWRAGGQEGEQPPTPNLDAMNKAHAAGQPKKAKKASAGTGNGRAPKYSDEHLNLLVVDAIVNHGCRTAGGVDVHLYNTGNGTSWPRIKAAFQQAVTDGIKLPERPSKKAKKES